MTAVDRRKTSRTETSLKFSPIKCQYEFEGTKISLEVMNYHFRGGCFKISEGDPRVLNAAGYLRFSIGNKDLAERIKFRIVWETLSENGCFGVEFTPESISVLSRADRFLVNRFNVPVISSQDPLDPNRTIYFKVLNISVNGLLLSSSMSNQHIFPGMEISSATLEIPNIGKTEIAFFIENAREGEEVGTIQFGVSIKGTSKNYLDLISKYLSNLGTSDDLENRIEKLSDNKLIPKALSKHLTIREVRDQKEYEKVLKLRFQGYSAAGKLSGNSTWQSTGEGLNKEGLIIAAYLGGQIVASAEFRLMRKHGLRLAEKFDLKALPGFNHDNFAEINKLVVHTRVQHTDIVLGIFQKIHAVAMLNGNPDGIITAEDKLISLYERLGFKKLGFDYPHPTKAGVRLHLMVIRGSAYATSNGMNPHAWSIAFEESYKFFSEVGIQKRQGFSPFFHLHRSVSAAAVKIIKKKKKNAPKIRANAASESIPNHAPVDPKWTKQHVNATVLYPYILEASDMIGAEKIGKILFGFGMKESYFKSVTNWVSIQFFDEFLDQFSSFGDLYALNRRAGYRSTSKDVLGANYYIMKHFFSPGLAFKSLEIYLPKFNKTRVYKLVSLTGQSCKIRITNPDKSLIPKHHSTRENWVALIHAYVETITGKPGTVKILKSTFDGDDCCEYQVSWTNRYFNFKNFILITLALIGFGELGLKLEGRVFGLKPFSLFASSLAIGVFFYALSKWIIIRKRYLEVLDSLHELERDTDEKYIDLQNSKSLIEKNYQEGKLLENIGREIQKTEDLTMILQTALSSICTKFDFKRAFIMILDDETNCLRTAAIHGSNEIDSPVWQYKVDVSVRRENPMLLSSIFHTGQSVLVNNADEHKFHLNEASRKLVENLDVRGFAIVPIPSQTTNWGVMIADKGQSTDIIARRDLVALQRVAQSIGMALDKKAKIDAEVKVRNIFQKFVPSSVVENTLKLKEPKLGGENREVICLFMDIRNFTNLSTRMPAQILCDLLNRIFENLQNSVSIYGGMIDKFLGDGALVTWGAVPGSALDPNDCLRAIEEFNRLHLLLNLEMKNRGLDSIEIGFGAHRGQALAGNIGSNDRMEFTVIGSVVNVASRLEQLTKVFKSQVVISESLIDFSQLGKKWIIHNNVQVRGVEKSLNVATLSWRTEHQSEREIA